MSNNLSFEYTNNGKDIVIEQYLIGDFVAVRRTFRWSSDVDCAELRLEAKILFNEDVETMNLETAVEVRRL